MSQVRAWQVCMHALQHEPAWHEAVVLFDNKLLLFLPLLLLLQMLCCCCCCYKCSAAAAAASTSALYRQHTSWAVVAAVAQLMCCLCWALGITETSLLSMRKPISECKGQARCTKDKLLRDLRRHLGCLLLPPLLLSWPHVLNQHMPAAVTLFFMSVERNCAIP